MGTLAAVKARFEALRAGNWLSANSDEKYDTAILPALVTAENARTHNLNLHLVSGSDGPTLGATVDKLPYLERHRVMFPLPPAPPMESHYLTADIRRYRGKTSIVIVEPLSPERGKYDAYWAEHYMPFLKEQFGQEASIAVLALDTQISGSDCKIFGLSHASKMAENPALFDSLHRQNLSGTPLKTSLGATAKTYVADGNIRLVDGTAILPASFVKHSQSKNSLNNWMQANPPAYANAAVNKADQTLTQRYDEHATTRFKYPQRVHYALSQGQNVPVKSATTSTSIEEKRMTYIDRAMAYFSQATEAESAQALAQMGRVDLSSSDMLQPWAAWQREWGPNPKPERPAVNAG